MQKMVDILKFGEFGIKSYVVCGILYQKDADQDTLIKMNKILSHRGPDDEGTWKSIIWDFHDFQF